MEDILAQVQACVLAGHFSQALQVMDESELRATAWQQFPQGGAELAGVHMILCLLTDDLDGARFLRRRCDFRVLGDNLYEALWVRDVPKFFQLATALLANRSALQPLHARLIELLVQTKRRDQLRLCEKAYATLSVQSACSLLGVSPQDLPRVCQENGWVLLANKEYVQPRARVQQQHVDASAAEQMKKLLDQAIFLENDLGTLISKKPATTLV